jgi:hypothetical protein
MQYPAKAGFARKIQIPGSGVLFSVVLFFVSLLSTQILSAAPSGVGKYGGISEDGQTFISFETTRRGFIRNLEIVGLTALCTTTIPGSEPEPSEERSTNIRKRETPLIRLRPSGQFSDDFNLMERGRMDFRGANVRVSGNLRGNRGSMLIVLTMDKTYEDGSTEVCGGSVGIRVQRIRP